MKVSDLLEKRQANWRELEELCGRQEWQFRSSLDAKAAARFASLYRSACADLALADAYQLPPSTTEYLHQLVGRAHNQLYRSGSLDWRRWGEALLNEVPRQLFRDNALRLAFLVFWVPFLISAAMAHFSPQYAESALGKETIMDLENMYSEPIGQGRGGGSLGMIGFYIWNNTGIGLQCFAAGLIFGVGGLFVTLFNAVFLGAAFGHMGTTPHRDNFFHFVTAHGPFELTAVVLASGLGMRLGFALVDTRGMTRFDSLRSTARKVIPQFAAFVLLFMAAAFIEALVSPSGAPYEIKAGVAIVSTLAMLAYVIGLGMRRGGD